jgi:hypothetical protein
LIVKPISYEIFGVDKRYLVLKVDNKKLHDRFNNAKKLGATFDFPSYKPHITLGELKDDIDLKSLPVPNFSIKTSAEYQEDLDLSK